MNILPYILMMPLSVYITQLIMARLINYELDKFETIVVTLFLIGLGMVLV